MAKMDEWLSSFIANVESLSTPKLKEECVKMFESFSQVDDKTYTNGNQLKEVCTRLDGFLLQSKPNSEPSKGTSLILDSFFTQLLDFLVELDDVSAEAHAYLRDETNILNSLTFLLSCKNQSEDRKKLLKTVEILTRDIVITWSVPYLTGLLKEVSSVILEDKMRPEMVLYCLRIMANLTYSSDYCLSMIIRDVSYKQTLKKGLAVLGEGIPNVKMLIHELQAMALHYCLLTDKSISIDVNSQIEKVRKTFTEIQERIERKNYDPREIATTVYYVTKLVSTMCNRHARDDEQSTDDSQTSTEKSNIKTIVDEVSSIVFKFFPKLFPMLRTESGQVVLSSLFKLLKALCPNNVPAKEYDNLWVSISKSLNELSMVSAQASNSQVVVLETHVHFLDRILGAEGRKLSVSAESFKYAMNNCSIVVSRLPIDLTRNILTVQLLNRLYALANSQNKKDSVNQVLAKINKLISDHGVELLLKDLVLDDNNKSQTKVVEVPSLQMSTCVVELFNIISKHSKGPSLLLELFDMEKAWFHVANCIANGNSELVSQAISVMGSVGFSSKSRSGVSRILVELRASTPTAVPASPERPKSFSFQAQMGMKRLNENLAMYELCRLSHSDASVSDLLAWYKLKGEMHEMELSNLNQQVLQLNKTISSLKSLMNKQADVLTYRTVSYATLEQENTELQKHLAIFKQRKLEVELKHLKAIESLQVQLNCQLELVNVKTKRLEFLEAEFVRLKALVEELSQKTEVSDQVVSKLENENKQLQKRVDVTEKELKSAKSKISTMETDLKKSEENRKNAENLLEAERRKTEIIQQVLGRGSM